MSQLHHFFISAAWMHLVFTLLHSIWQGVAVAVVLWAVLRGIPSRRTDLRYGVAVLALGGLLMGALVTWAVLGLEPKHPRVATQPATAAVIRETGVVSQPTVNPNRSVIGEPASTLVSSSAVVAPAG